MGGQIASVNPTGHGSAGLLSCIVKQSRARVPNIIFLILRIQILNRMRCKGKHCQSSGFFLQLGALLLGSRVFNKRGEKPP